MENIYFIIELFWPALTSLLIFILVSIILSKRHQRNRKSLFELLGVVFISAVSISLVIFNIIPYVIPAPQFDESSLLPSIMLYGVYLEYKVIVSMWFGCCFLLIGLLIAIWHLRSRSFRD